MILLQKTIECRTSSSFSCIEIEYHLWCKARIEDQVGVGQRFKLDRLPRQDSLLCGQLQWIISAYRSSPRSHQRILNNEHEAFRQASCQADGLCSMQYLYILKRETIDARYNATHQGTRGHWTLNRRYIEAVVTSRCIFYQPAWHKQTRWIFRYNQKSSSPENPFWNSLAKEIVTESGWWEYSS